MTIGNHPKANGSDMVLVLCSVVCYTWLDCKLHSTVAGVLFLLHLITAKKYTRPIVVKWYRLWLLIQLG